MSQEDLLLQLLLPAGILDYFVLTNIHHDQKEIWIYLEEKNTTPVEYANDKLISKGFMEESSIQDFPIRGRAVHLFVKRRRWHNTTTGQLVTRNWNMVAEGTRMTREFASFLKAISRYRTR